MEEGKASPAAEPWRRPSQPLSGAGPATPRRGRKGHWTPDAVFLGAHIKPQLRAMLTAMAVDDPHAAGLKKDELIALAVAQAAERR